MIEIIKEICAPLPAYGGGAGVPFLTPVIEILPLPRAWGGQLINYIKTIKRIHVSPPAYGGGRGSNIY
jgi:hypothetical protein